MKAVLEFNLPEDSEEHLDAINGASWKAAMFSLDQHLRGIVKYGDDATAAVHAQAMRNKLHEILQQWNLTVY